MADADVVVVGCGPSGVMAALRSAQRGLSVIAIDTSSDVYPLPRAIGLDAEGQRLFHTAGLGPELESCSTPMRGAEFLDAQGTRVVGFDLPVGFRTPLGHPPIVAFEQPELEAALRAAAIAAGVDMRLGVTATGLSVESDGVRLDTSAGLITARWLLGADGASSWVRANLGIKLEDQGFDQPWLVVDTTNLDPDLELSRLAQQHCDPARIVTMVPGHGRRRRWEFQLHSDEIRSQMLEPPMIAELLRPWGDPTQLRVDRAAVYRFHGLVADEFRRGPAFLIGDAAHQMPPFQGQGMCSGLRDADNLAWKLALVKRWVAGDALLDTYEVERRPHAVAIVGHSCDAGRLIDAIASGVDPSTKSGYGGGRAFPHLENGFLESGHGAVGKPMPQPMIDGTPLDARLGDGFGLVATTPIEPPPVWAEVGTTAVTVPPGVLPRELDDPDLVTVVRPDRYVAAVTRDLELTTHRLWSGLLA